MEFIFFVVLVGMVYETNLSSLSTQMEDVCHASPSVQPATVVVVAPAPPKSIGYKLSIGILVILGIIGTVCL